MAGFAKAMGKFVGAQVHRINEQQLEIERLRKALLRIAQHDTACGHLDRDKNCMHVARVALDYGLPDAEDVRGILKPEI